jgi:DNA-binding transcriptional LysR family regulator
MNEPWALGPLDSFSGAIQAEVFRSSGLPCRGSRSVSVNLRNELLATGRFFTVFPGFSLRLPRRHSSLRALPVELPTPPIPIAIVTLREPTLNPIAKPFIERVREITKPLRDGK